MSTSLEAAINRNRRLHQLNRRLTRVRMQYFDHEDQGKLEKHERVVRMLNKAIRNIC